ncbi:MAG: amino acid permease [Rothia sp. (in: high G+C Gram-positive bacteria)]|nr:amino acid permease [Rothia sp. (in: high G+C Gram-positive bacteria)]
MSSTPEQTSAPLNRSEEAFQHEDAGLHKGLGKRQLQMIAIGSAIGTGLFLGSASRLESAGPSLFIVYAVCGFFGYIILRALGELIVHRPSSGSFVSYSREFYGEKAAYVSGWLYWLNWAMTLVADATAVAIYIKWFGQYSTFLADMSQGLLALVVVTFVLCFNLVSVKLFGELEFWFSLIKVAALVIFMLVGIYFVIFGNPNGDPVGFSLITDNGGLLPNGLVPALIVVQGVVFAYAGIELVGTTSGETKDARTIIPKAINTVILRIAIFYVGSILLLCMLLPYTAYQDGVSPFVTFFDSIGVAYAAPIMQLVVITAALSSLNAGLYSTGHILYSMSQAGSAPRFAGKLSASGVPFGGILLTAVVAVAGVFLNFVVPEAAFEIVLSMGALGTMAGWAAITLSHMKFVKLAQQGLYERPSYRLPFTPLSDWLVLIFLGGVVVLMAIDYPVGTFSLAAFLLVIPILVAGWYVVRRRVGEIAKVREGYTGNFPIVARPPAVDALERKQGRVNIHKDLPGGSDR